MSYRIGYVRVSSVDQNTDRQLEGVKVDQLFTEKASGKDVNRPELKRLLESVRSGDTVVAHSMDRLARNMVDLLGLVKELNGKGVVVEFVKERLTFTGESDHIAELMLKIMGAVAEFERAIIKERQREGIEVAKAKGVYAKHGRKQEMTPERISEIKERAARGEPKAQIARSMRISRDTMYRYLKV